MVCKIIFLLYAVLHSSVCQMPDFDPNGDFPIPDFDPYQMGDFDQGDDIDQDSPINFNPFGSLGGTMGETSAVLHDETQEVEARLGASVKLPCHVTNPGTFTVFWTFLKNNKQLTDGDTILADSRDYGLELQYPAEWNLIVKDVRPDDAGEYLCLLPTVPPQMKSVFLVLIAPPRIEKSSLMERYTVLEGETLEVICEVTGYPPPTIQWYSYHTNPTTFEEEKELFSNNSVLTIGRIQRSDGGIYGCEAANSQGKDMYEIMIETEYKPIPNTLSQDILVKNGMSAKLECIYYSNPRAQLEWRKGREKLRRNWKYSIDNYREEKLQGSVLTIRSTDQSDNGNYKCVATNDIGQSITTFTVIVVQTTTTTEPTTTTTTTTIRTTTSSTSSSTKSRPTPKKSKPIITPGPVEIVDTTTQKTKDDSPRLGQSQSEASCCHSFSITLTLLTIMLSLLLKVS